MSDDECDALCDSNDDVSFDEFWAISEECEINPGVSSIVFFPEDDGTAKIPCCVCGKLIEVDKEDAQEACFCSKKCADKA